MMNETIILNALNTAISKIERGNDPIIYLYRVQKVLNAMREMIYDKLDSSRMMCEPSEMFNITIRGSVRINRSGSEPVIVGHSPFILKVYGFRGLGIADYRLAEDYSATKTSPTISTGIRFL